MTDEALQRETAPRNGKIGRTRWTVAGVAGAGTFVNYLDRINLSAAAPDMMRHFGMSASEMEVLSSAFRWTYAVLQMPVGAVVDHIGVARVNRVAAALWAFASFLSAAAGGLGLLLVARLVLGVGEAPTVTAGWTALGQWFPRRERGRAAAVFDGCAKLSNVVGLPAMALLVAAFGWRAVFVSTSVLSVGYLVAWWLLYTAPKRALAAGRLGRAEFDHVRAGGADQEDAPAPALTGVGHLLRRRKTWGLALGYASYTCAYYVLLTWLPTYLTRQFGVNLLQSGISAVVPWAVALLAQFFIGGLLLDRLIARTGDETRTRRIVWCAAWSPPAVSGAAWTRSTVLAVLFLSVGAGGLAVSVRAASSIPALLAPEAHRLARRDRQLHRSTCSASPPPWSPARSSTGPVRSAPRSRSPESCCSAASSATRSCSAASSGWRRRPPDTEETWSPPRSASSRPAATKRPTAR